MTLSLVQDTEFRSLSDSGSCCFAEWQTPPAVLTLFVIDNNKVIAALDSRDFESEGSKSRSWRFTQQVAQTHFPAILDFLKQFRESKPQYWKQYGEDFETDLANFIPDEDWSKELETVDPKAMEFWETHVAMDPKLRDLARAGYDLYNAVFPPDSWLRTTLDSLPLGSRIDVTWTPDCGQYVSNIPWGLFHRTNPKFGEPISGSEFWGLRFRVDYHTYELQDGNRSRALGRPDEAKLGHVYYWKGDNTDTALREALWQRRLFATYAGHIALPDEADTTPKETILDWLKAPVPNPMRTLYFYCKARVTNQCFLEFGNDLDSNSVTIRDVDLPNERMKEIRFIFCNACESGMAQQGQAANRLEKLFFDWGCMAYLGTIHETPIETASRFAVTFFHLFCNRVDGKIISTGESCVQARRFFWLKYRNLGGLFFNYVNEFDLFLADKNQLENS